MRTTSRFIPFHHLPPGFAASLDNPPRPSVRPRPASTLVLLRDAPAGLEILLLRRSPALAFIPGAFVFPGGRVEAEDTAPDLLARLSGGDPAILGARMELDHDEREAGDAVSPPAFAFLAAALREAFEEAGILLAKPPHGCRTIALGDPGTGEEARSRLLEGSLGFAEVLAGMAIELDAAALEYIGRWITPEPEPWRYDTRFFAARVPPDCAAIPDLREMVEARWMRPGEALAHNQGGSLPLVFPTLRTLEALAGFDRADDFLRHHRGRRVPGLLPKLVVREGGIEIVTEEPGG